MSFLEMVSEAERLRDEIYQKNTDCLKAYDVGDNNLGKELAGEVTNLLEKFVPLYNQVTNPYHYLKKCMELIGEGKVEQIDLPYAMSLVKKLQTENKVELEKARAEFRKYFKSR